ncbi:MAG: hypothetical protein MHM6MM_007260 [Cercozoa sp. M6MM]
MNIVSLNAEAPHFPCPSLRPLDLCVHCVHTWFTTSWSLQLASEIRTSWFLFRADAMGHMYDILIHASHMVADVDDDWLFGRLAPAELQHQNHLPSFDGDEDFQEHMSRSLEPSVQLNVVRKAAERRRRAQRRREATKKLFPDDPMGLSALITPANVEAHSYNNDNNGNAGGSEYINPRTEMRDNTDRDSADNSSTQTDMTGPSVAMQHETLANLHDSNATTTSDRQPRALNFSGLSDVSPHVSTIQLDRWRIMSPHARIP